MEFFAFGCSPNSFNQICRTFPPQRNSGSVIEREREGEIETKNYKLETFKVLLLALPTGFLVHYKISIGDGHPYSPAIWSKKKFPVHSKVVMLALKKI